MGYFTNMLVHSAVLKTTDGSDSNGSPNIVSEKKIKCRIEFTNSMVISSNGQQLVSSGRLFTEDVPKVNDLLEISGKNYQIIKIAPNYALDGAPVIKEVYFK